MVTQEAWDAGWREQRRAIGMGQRMPSKMLPYARAAWRVARRDGLHALTRKLARRAASWTEDIVAGAARRPPGASVRVAVYANWDITPAIKFLTPGGTGTWGGVYFGHGPAVSNPDFVLILNSPSQDVLEVNLPAERIWFAAGEPPEFKPYHLGQGQGTVVLTCDASIAASPPSDRDSVLLPPVLQTWQVRRSIDQLARMTHVEKTKGLSWVTSAKDALPGHKLRMFFLRSIWGKVPFDLYGRGFNPIDDKWDGIAPYRYSIAFENARTANYFSEKLMDCFVCLTLPLYYGSPEIHKYFPARSFVTIEPGDPHAAEKIRDVIASELWKEREDALQEAKWLVLYKYNMFSQVSRLMLERLKPATTPQTLRIQRTNCEYG
jgi:glycosyl transferase family 10 (putative fucosyltransferase)